MTHSPQPPLELCARKAIQRRVRLHMLLCVLPQGVGHIHSNARRAPRVEELRWSWRAAEVCVEPASWAVTTRLSPGGSEARSHTRPGCPAWVAGCVNLANACAALSHKQRDSAQASVMPKNENVSRRRNALSTSVGKISLSENLEYPSSMFVMTLPEFRAPGLCRHSSHVFNAPTEPAATNARLQFQRRALSSLGTGLRSIVTYVVPSCMQSDTPAAMRY